MNKRGRLDICKTSAYNQKGIHTMKKIVSFILAALIVASLLSACNGKDNNTSSLQEISKPAETSVEPAGSEPDTSSDESPASPEESSEAEPEHSINDMHIVEVIERVRTDADLDPNTYSYSEITPLRREYYFGFDIDCIESVCCDPMMITNAFSLSIVKVEPEKLEGTAALIEQYADTSKWICVHAEEKKVVTNGNYILLIMSSSEDVKKVTEAFLNIK